MIENFLQYGQWVILILSIMSLYLVSSVKHETRLNGYILTGVARFSGAAVFIFVDLFAFVIANLIQNRHKRFKENPNRLGQLKVG